VSYDYDVQGRALDDLAGSARRELVAQAAHFTSQYRDVNVSMDDPIPRIFLAGHQPELFHPGVWLKNFALGRLAERHSALAINLLIDCDTVRRTALRVPGGDVQAPVERWIQLDRPGAHIPYEERAILEPEVFRSFGARAANTIQPLVADPMLAEFWPLAVERSREVDNLGRCLAQARHQWEGRWGLTTLELPQSRVCSFAAFHWFLAHLLAQLPRLWEAYNSALASYRRANRVRSKAHPVPNLSCQGPWLEAPFWVWQCGDPIRRALFVRQRGDHILLSDGKQWELALKLEREGQAHKACQQLADLAQRGIKIRTRAIVTTLFARLLLSDMFIHGIGGAKYDEMTDQLIRDFFGFEPPEYLVASATLRLPIARQQVTMDDERRIRRQLREMTFHPEKYIDLQQVFASEERDRIRAIISTKQQWIDAARTEENGHARHVGITQATSALQPWIAAKRQTVIGELQRSDEALRNQAVLASREYAFCLHPERTLRQLIDTALPV
jgi:hypothetical protein